MKNNLTKVSFKEREKDVETQRHEFNLKWINLLTENKLDRMIEFDEVLSDSKSEVFAIMKYRRMLREEGRGKNIMPEDLKVNNKISKEYLRRLLQELFLEPILDWHLEFFIKKISEKHNNLNEAIEELYRLHKRDINNRFLTIALTI